MLVCRKLTGIPGRTSVDCPSDARDLDRNGHYNPAESRRVDAIRHCYSIGNSILICKEFLITWNLSKVMDIHNEKEHSLFPMLPAKVPDTPTCSAMVGLLEDKSKRIVTEWTGTLGQLETKKCQADQLKLSSGS